MHGFSLKVTVHVACHFKIGNRMELYGHAFKKNVSTFEKLMSRLVVSIVNTLRDSFLVAIRDSTCSMKEVA